MEKAPVDSEVAHRPLFLRALFVSLVLFAGVAGMVALTNLRKDPKTTEPPSPVLGANAIEARSQSFEIQLKGFGTARSQRVASLGAEVAGRIISVHPRLDEGMLIPAGETLIQIDPIDYELALEEVTAEVRRIEQELERLAVEEENDAERLRIAREVLDVARRDYERVNELFKAQGAESEARLDAARGALRRQEQLVVEVERAVALAGPRRAQVEAQLSATRSRRQLAERNIDRTGIKAPFDARIVREAVEVGERVAPGVPLVTVAEDSVLEISVPLDSREVAKWLGAEPDAAGRWFKAFTDRSASVFWTDCPDVCEYQGILSHIASFDEATRTFHVIVKVPKEDGAPFPLAAGMFVQVAIPGQTLDNVIPVPREAIDSRGNVLVANGGSIRTTPVAVAAIQGNMALVKDGLVDGDVVLTSHPPDVIDGMKVDAKMVASPSVPAESR